MAVQNISNTTGDLEQETSAITVGAGEKIAVRLSQFAPGASCILKIVGNSSTTLEPIGPAQMNTVFDSIPAGHAVSVVTNRHASGGGIVGVLESYT